MAFGGMIVFAFATAGGQTNQMMSPFGQSLIAENNRPRAWSPEIHQYLMQSVSTKAGRGSPGLRSSADPGTGGSNSIAVVQQTQAEIEEERMDKLARRMDDSGYGMPPASSRRWPSTVERGLVSMFTPEPIRLGRAEFGFSPYTAVKRRNPLCLLNPLPLTLSW